MGVQLRRARRASQPRPLKGRSHPGCALPRCAPTATAPHRQHRPPPRGPPPIFPPHPSWARMHCAPPPPQRRPTPACPLPGSNTPHPDGAPRGGGGIPTLRPLVAPHAPHPRVRPAYLGRSCSTSRIGRLLRAGGRLLPGSRPSGPPCHRGPAVG